MISSGALTDKVKRPDSQPNDEWGTYRRRHDGRLAARGYPVRLNVGLGMDELNIEESYRIAADLTRLVETRGRKPRRTLSEARGTTKVPNADRPKAFSKIGKGRRGHYKLTCQMEKTKTPRDIAMRTTVRFAELNAKPNSKNEANR